MLYPVKDENFMIHRAILKHSVAMFIFSVAVLLCLSAIAGEPADKKALFYSTDVEELKWAPCPE